MSDVQKTIEDLLTEGRTFAPGKKLRENANVKSDAVYKRAARNREKFWANFAKELDWFKKWSRVLKWKAPHSEWFVGGKLNVSYNCLDRHINTARKNKAAIIWEAESGESVTLTYWELYREVNKFANVLKELGVNKGDRVTIYLPMIPELAIAMLACTRIGAPHSIVFGGFSAESLMDRINDSKARILITSDGGYRRGGIVPLKKNADDALTDTPTIEKVVVVKRIGDKAPVKMKKGRDLWWHELMENAQAYCEPEKMDSEDMLFMLYTSGTTGKPKGIVHTTGGYLVGVYATTKWVFDLKEEDTYWCTADIGWVTGHSYIVYGPLANGATSLMYEGAPDYPDIGRFWAIIEKYGVSIFYTAPTAIRAFMRWGEEYPQKYDLSSLRLLGSVGEPINPEAWMWYYTHIGGGRCPVVDTWWQTETGSILITPLPGITKLKPGSATKPFPGIQADIVDENGKSIKEGAGYLVLRSPWPSMLRTIYGDPKRYVDQYWSRFPGLYFTGDGAKRDKDGYFWLLGRVDDVMNVAGHRISTMEVESALVDHHSVAEAAVIGRHDELKGQAIVAFTTLKKSAKHDDSMIEELRNHVAKKIGPIARPDDIIFTAELPKTRSGKIMRRLLKNIAEGAVLGDTTTLADPAVVHNLKEQYEHLEG
ncbi:MAG TPA: acetate--CoA ligase [Thermodesulfobacteriota bacterium]|nr:acetate--CoA ligase [Thermodesulfobacteriota bacterium]